MLPLRVFPAIVIEEGEIIPRCREAVPATIMYNKKWLKPDNVLRGMTGVGWEWAGAHAKYEFFLRKKKSKKTPPKAEARAYPASFRFGIYESIKGKAVGLDDRFHRSPAPLFLIFCSCGPKTCAPQLIGNPRPRVEIRRRRSEKNDGLTPLF